MHLNRSLAEPHFEWLSKFSVWGRNCALLNLNTDTCPPLRPDTEEHTLSVQSWSVFRTVHKGNGVLLSVNTFRGAERERWEERESVSIVWFTTHSPVMAQPLVCLQAGNSIQVSHTEARTTYITTCYLYSLRVQTAGTEGGSWAQPRHFAMDAGGLAGVLSTRPNALLFIL